MIKALLLSFLLLFSNIGSLTADSIRALDDPGLYAVNSYFFCNYKRLKKSETERALDGKYQKSVAELMLNDKKRPAQNCSFKVTKNFLNMYPAETTAASDFLYGALYMTDIYSLAAHNLEALKVTGKEPKPTVGAIHFLPGGYKKQFTISGEWEDYKP